MELEQGLFHIDAKTYHKLPGISYTGVKEFQRSPAHYKAMLEGGKEETAAMRFGSAYHCYNLEHEFFHKEFVVRPSDLNPRSKEGQRWHEEHKDLTVITQEEMDTIRAMADVLWAHPQWKRLSPQSEREVALIWLDSEFEVWCRTRIDLLSLTFGIPSDLKTTQDARHRSFIQSAWRFGYHVQASWTLRGLRAVTGEEHDTFLFFAQEKGEPFAVSVYETTGAFLEAGNIIVKQVLPVYAHCLKNDFWPGYPDEIKPLSTPEWLRDEEQLAIFE